MSAKLRLVFAITIGFASFWGYSQNNYWEQVANADNQSKDFLKNIDSEHAKVFKVNEGMLKGSLKSLLPYSRSGAKIYFPDENRT